MKNHSLSKKIVVSIILFSSFITLILTAAQLYSEYNNDISNVNNTIQQIKTGYMNGIESYVWLDDKEELVTILNGINELPEISYISISVNGENYVSSGNAIDSNPISEKFPLTYNYNNKALKIGELYIESDLAAVHQRL